jgi:hypothetical protein
VKSVAIPCAVALALFIASAPARAQTTAAAAGLSDEKVRDILSGFDRRVAQAFEAQRGKPLVRAQKQPPLGPGRANYVRAYSFSIVEFATRCFILGEQTPEANAALIENAQYYLDNPAAITDRDSFHWHSEMLLRLIELYGAKGARARGLLTPEAEAKMMEAVWQYARRNSKLADAETARSLTWHVRESENHHAQGFATLWHFARLAKNAPAWRGLKYDDGADAAAHYAAWTEYIKRYCLERARKGLFIEAAADNYNLVGLKGFHNVFDFAEDAELKRRAGLLLDLFWATWAQEQFDGVRGGGRARIYQGPGSLTGRGSHLRQLVWFYFGLGEAPATLMSPLLPALTSEWRPPAVVVDIACDPDGRGRYAVVERPLGLAEPGFERPPDYRLRTDFGGIRRYSWCTPAFIVGTLMTEARPMTDWTHISSQNRWQGVIFAGNVDARIVPQVRAADGRVVMNGHWSAQARGSLVTQKLKTNKGGGAMRVWFSESGVTPHRDEAGWSFVETPRAYAAVRAVTGGVTWEAATGVLKGSWMTCREEGTPVIVEVAEKKDFASYAEFRKAVTALPLSFEKNVLAYQGLAGDRIVFYADYSRVPEINGAPVDYAPAMAFDSPFVRGEWNAGTVTVSKGGRQLRLDFNGR